MMVNILVKISTAKVKISGAKNLSTTNRMASCNNFDICVCHLFTKPEVNTENDRHHFHGSKYPSVLCRTLSLNFKPTILQRTFAFDCNVPLFIV